MQKSNITNKQKVTLSLACFISMCVLALSLHAKDLVRYHDMEVARKVDYRNISEKAASELHDHVDKQIVKNLIKNTSNDSILLTRSRGEMPEVHEGDPGIASRLSEKILLWRIFLTLPFTV